jgi:hypothetical protein
MRFALGIVAGLFCFTVGFAGFFRPQKRRPVGVDLETYIIEVTTLVMLAQ